MDRWLSFRYQQNMTDFARARLNMVESQVRPNGVTDSRILNAMATLPREAFVPEAQRPLAYMDEDVAVAPSRFLMEPMAQARLIQLAEIGPEDRVLQVGCATGYGTAIIASLARSVEAIDEDAALVVSAQAALRDLAIANASVTTAPLAEGKSSGAPYDVIVVEGRVPSVPDQLLRQLGDGGRLVAVIGDRPVATATLIKRHGAATSVLAAFEASVAALPGFTIERPAFVF
jgi:protein-L-isoaspartate(D-aspartate) O-methyltransferase